MDVYRCTGSDRRSALSYSKTTTYGLQQQKNEMKMMKTLLTWRMVLIVAT